MGNFRCVCFCLFVFDAPVCDADEDGPVELPLEPGGLRSARVDEGVNGGQLEALLVQLQHLGR